VEVGAANWGGVVSAHGGAGAAFDAAAPPVQFEIGGDLEEILLCTPGIGPTPTAHFVTRYCNAKGLIPAWDFTLEYIAAYESHVDLHVEKSRQMLISWLGCACFLHSLMFERGFAGLMASRLQDLVDDGGEHSTTDSLFGRIRHLYEHLPPWLQQHAPVRFAHLRISCPSMQSYIVGDASKGNTGRGGTYDRALVDEAAYIEMSEASHRALRPACPRGIIYQSTPNGRKNLFGRIRYNRESGFTKLSYHWSRHPSRKRGLYTDEDGKARSPWYDAATQDLSDEQRAREYDLDYTTSLSGIVYKEFSIRTHVKPASTLPLLPGVTVSVGIDFGHARKTAALICQQVGPVLRVIQDFEGKHRAARLNAIDLATLLRATGFTPPLKSELLELVPDPTGQYEGVPSGNSILSYYDSVGFKRVRFPMLQGPGSVALGIELVREKLVAGEIVISDSCRILIDRIEDYRYKTDRITDDIKSNIPDHDMASHIMDALRYVVTGLFTAAGPNPLDDFTPLSERAYTQDGERSILDDDDDSAPSGPGRMLPAMRAQWGLY